MTSKTENSRPWNTRTPSGDPSWSTTSPHRNPLSGSGTDASRILEGSTRIARGWNTKDAENGNVGYGLRFDVDSTYLSQFDVQQVGDDECLEYWIPAEELDTFNEHIVGEIEVVSEWRA